MKWSEEENNFKCSGKDRPHRTFDKIVDHAKLDDARESKRLKDQEELIIKQAPRSLQTEVAQEILREKKF